MIRSSVPWRWEKKRLFYDNVSQFLAITFATHFFSHSLSSCDMLMKNRLTLGIMRCDQYNSLLSRCSMWSWFSSSSYYFRLSLAWCFAAVVVLLISDDFVNLVQTNKIDIFIASTSRKRFNVVTKNKKHRSRDIKTENASLLSVSAVSKFRAILSIIKEIKSKWNFSLF